MKFLRNLSVFVLLILVESIQLAPVEDNKTVYSLIKSDNRFEKLSQQTFTKECEKANKPICSALLDLALRFSDAKLDFTREEVKHDDSFCDSQLLKTLPDAPTHQETSSILKNFNIAWFKDTIKDGDEKCNAECTYESFEDYSLKVKPVCFFIYSQYKFLETQQKPQVSESPTTTITINNNASTSVEQQQQQQQKAVAVNDTTKPQTQPASISFASEAGEIDVVPANVEIKSTTSTASKNDSQQAQVPSTDEEKQAEGAPAKTETKVKEVPLVDNKNEEANATSNKSETPQTKDDTKPVNFEDENSLPEDNGVFDPETQNPGKEQDQDLNGLDMGGDLGDDDEDENYPENFNRDNNRNDQNQKFPQEQINEIEGPDADSVPHIQSVQFQEDPDSNFFTYLCITMFLSILLYILYHNRQKLLALLLEGRRDSRRSRERSRGGSKAAYSKLDCNLEEAITSKKSLSSKSMDIIY